VAGIMIWAGIIGWHVVVLSTKCEGGILRLLRQGSSAIICSHHVVLVFVVVFFCSSFGVGSSFSHFYYHHHCRCLLLKGTELCFGMRIVISLSFWTSNFFLPMAAHIFW
jgi:hypothetical protein